MKLNTTEVLVDLQEQPIKAGNADLTVGLAIANVLALSKSNDPLRAYELALEVKNAEGELELNSSDVDFIQQEVKQTQLYTTLVQGAILSMLK